MKTLFRFEIIGFDENASFFELDGDYSHLDGVFINVHESQDLVDELHSLVYDENGDFKFKKLQKPTKDWDVYVECGWYC